MNAEDEVVARILDTMRRAADPSAMTREFCGRVFPDDEAVRVLAVGKAGATMMRAGLDMLGSRVSAGVVIAPEEQCEVFDPVRGVRVMPSDHPLPTERSVAAAEALLSFVAEGEEPLIVLLSGGGSAMTVAPIEGVSLDDLRSIADGLMRAGATIDELNCVRKHLDLAKGGRVGLATNGRPVAVGVISDVMGDRLDVISSGPFVGDASTFAEARHVLDRTGVSVSMVNAVIEAGEGGLIEETPKPGDERLAAIMHEVLASNVIVTQAAAAEIERLGMPVEPHLAQAGEAGDWGVRVADRLKRGAGAIVLGGECVVSGVSKGSLGGPMQEAVLAAGHALRDVPGWLVIGYATDGVDGPTPAAGAVLTPESLPNAKRCAAALKAHNSFSTLAQPHALINGAPTGTNLNDVLIGIRWPT
ncbi:MAG: DUF4147 domain-containing protein [Planctomycetota bacterium]